MLLRHLHSKFSEPPRQRFSSPPQSLVAFVGGPIPMKHMGREFAMTPEYKQLDSAHDEVYRESATIPCRLGLLFSIAIAMIQSSKNDRKVVVEVMLRNEFLIRSFQ